MLALKMVGTQRVFTIPLLWIFSQFILFSFISTETLFRAHLNALPPLVLFAPLFIIAAWSWIERKSLPERSQGVFHSLTLLRGVEVIAILLVMLPPAITLGRVLKNPFYNPFSHGGYQHYLHPLEAEERLVKYIEHALPKGSVIFISSSSLHAMNVQLRNRKEYTFVNVTALYLDREKEHYKDHLKKFYPGYDESNPHYIVTQQSEFPLECFKSLEPFAHFNLVATIHSYKIVKVDFSRVKDKGQVTFREDYYYV